MNAPAYPQYDDEFQDHEIKAVSEDGSHGWSITNEEGWSFFVPASSPVKPVAGMRARYYGRGVGFAVRGLFIEGVKVFYRDEAENDQHQNEQLYGADAKDWLARWDEGRSVWSIEMGGIGPGYEQAIQIAAAETLRHLLAEKYDASAWMHRDAWTHDCTRIETAVWATTRVNALQLSGAQWGSALNVATNLYKRGPLLVLTDPAMKDRLILVCKNFPSVA